MVYGGAALLCGTMGREVDCRCCHAPGGAQREGYPERPREDRRCIVEHEDFRVAAVCLSIAVLQVSDRGATRTEESDSVNGKMTGGGP